MPDQSTIEYLAEEILCDDIHVGIPVLTSLIHAVCLRDIEKLDNYNNINIYRASKFLGTKLIGIMFVPRNLAPSKLEDPIQILNVSIYLTM